MAETQTIVDNSEFRKRILARYGSFENYKESALEKPKHPGPRKWKCKHKQPKRPTRVTMLKQASTRHKNKPKKKRRLPPILHKLKYHAYLNTDAWRKKRLAVITRDGRRCVRCGSEKQLQVHHTTYTRIFRERLSDLITLCRDCHKKEHGIK